MRAAALCLLIACLAVSAVAADSTSAVVNTSFVTPDGEHVLRHEAIIPASIDSVWWALTTAEGVKTWMVPVASIDLRTGGLWETNYNPSARLGDSNNIRNVVLSYIPREMVSFRIGLTRQFPPIPREAGTLFYVITFQDLGGNRTKCVGSMLGWGKGEQWDDVYKKFEWGNDYTFKKLYERFTKGPVDWTPKQQ